MCKAVLSDGGGRHPHYHTALAGFALEGRSQVDVAANLGKKPSDVRNYCTAVAASSWPICARACGSDCAEELAFLGTLLES